MTGVSQAAHSLPTGFDTLASDNPINSQSRGMIPTGFKQEIRGPTATTYRVSSADTRWKYVHISSSFLFCSTRARKAANSSETRFNLALSLPFQNVCFPLQFPRATNGH